MQSLLRYELEEDEGTGSNYLEVWSNEARRLFKDRLVTTLHQTTFEDLLATILREAWSLDPTYSTDVKHFCTFTSQNRALLSAIKESDLKAIITKALVNFGKKELTITVHISCDPHMVVM